MKNKKHNSKKEINTNFFFDKHNSSYLLLFQKFNDIVSNVQDENLQKRIIYNYMEIENFLFKEIEKESFAVMSKIYDVYLDLKSKNKDTLLLFKVRNIFYIFRWRCKICIPKT